MILRDKVAIVTGSSRGIGAATAKLLAAHGAKVAVNYAQSREKGEKVVEEIVRAGGKAILAHADVTEREDVEAMLEKTEAALGPVDILVINASIHFPVTPFVQYKWRTSRRRCWAR
jgi:3-oxoacyl-[acyl-carrier protein] reductase